MTETHPSWAVVATVDEPAILVQAFVAWHLSLGAQGVTLYFDRPDDPVADLFGHLPQVSVIRCDAAHWRGFGKLRPERHQIRQLRNATQAYGSMTADWLLHADADEYIWPDKPVATVLADAAGADALAVPVAERIYTGTPSAGNIFAGPFRRPFPGGPAVGKRLFGPDYPLTRRGLTGHANGKAFTARGRPVEVSIHRPVWKGPRDDGPVRLAQLPGLELLHFDGLTPLNWVYKLLRKADALAHHNGMPPSEHRHRQMEALLEEVQSAFALHDRLKLVSAAHLSVLRRRKLLVEPAFDPLPALERWFPQSQADLRMEAFDDWLRREKAQILAMLDGSA